MDWNEAVCDAVERVTRRHGSPRFTRPMLLAEELTQIVSDTQTKRSDPDQGVSSYLQELRNNGIIEFIDNSGTYLFLRMEIAVEKQELPDHILDGFIKLHKLLFGDVPVSEGESLARFRKGQDRLRHLTLANYGNQCALCDIADETLLVTSHIVRWADDAEAREDLSNIICLCRFHDILFETGLFSLTDQLEIVKRSTEKCEMLSHLLALTSRFRIKNKQFRPSPKYLQKHRARVRIVL